MLIVLIFATAFSRCFRPGGMGQPGANPDSPTHRHSHCQPGGSCRRSFAPDPLLGPPDEIGQLIDAFNSTLARLEGYSMPSSASWQTSATNCARL